MRRLLPAVNRGLMKDLFLKQSILRRAGRVSVLALALGLSAGCVVTQGPGAGAAPPAGAGPGAGADASAAGGEGPAQTNLLKASNFDDNKSLPWNTSFTAP